MFRLFGHVYTVPAVTYMFSDVYGGSGHHKIARHATVDSITLILSPVTPIYDAVYSPPSTQSSSPPLTRSSPNEERNCNVEETRAWEERRAMNKRTLLADEKFLQTFVVESESRARRSRRRGN